MKRFILILLLFSALSAEDQRIHSKYKRGVFDELYADPDSGSVTLGSSSWEFTNLIPMLRGTYRLPGYAVGNWGMSEIYDRNMLGGWDSNPNEWDSIKVTCKGGGWYDPNTKYKLTDQTGEYVLFTSLNNAPTDKDSVRIVFDHHDSLSNFGGRPLYQFFVHIQDTTDQQWPDTVLVYIKSGIFGWYSCAEMKCFNFADTANTSFWVTEPINTSDEFGIDQFDAVKFLFKGFKYNPTYNYFRLTEIGVRHLDADPLPNWTTKREFHDSLDVISPLVGVVTFGLGTEGDPMNAHTADDSVAVANNDYIIADPLVYDTNDYPVYSFYPDTTGPTGIATLAMKAVIDDTLVAHRDDINALADTTIVHRTDINAVIDTTVVHRTVIDSLKDVKQVNLSFGLGEAFYTVPGAIDTMNMNGTANYILFSGSQNDSHYSYTVYPDTTGPTGLATLAMLSVIDDTTAVHRTEINELKDGLDNAVIFGLGTEGNPLQATTEDDTVAIVNNDYVAMDVTVFFAEDYPVYSLYPDTTGPTGIMTLAMKSVIEDTLSNHRDDINTLVDTTIVHRTDINSLVDTTVVHRTEINNLKNNINNVTFGIGNEGGPISASVDDDTLAFWNNDYIVVDFFEFFVNYNYPVIDLYPDTTGSTGIATLAMKSVIEDSILAHHVIIDSLKEATSDSLVYHKTKIDSIAQVDQDSTIVHRTVIDSLKDVKQVGLTVLYDTGLWPNDMSEDHYQFFMSTPYITTYFPIAGKGTGMDTTTVVFYPDTTGDTGIMTLAMKSVIEDTLADHRTDINALVDTTEAHRTELDAIIDWTDAYDETIKITDTAGAADYIHLVNSNSDYMKLRAGDPASSRDFHFTVYDGSTIWYPFRFYIDDIGTNLINLRHGTLFVGSSGNDTEKHKMHLTGDLVVTDSVIVENDVIIEDNLYVDGTLTFNSGLTKNWDAGNYTITAQEFNADSQIDINTTTSTTELNINGDIYLQSTNPRPAKTTKFPGGSIYSTENAAGTADAGFLRLSAGGGSNTSYRGGIDIGGYGDHAIYFWLGSTDIMELNQTNLDIETNIVMADAKIIYTDQVKAIDTDGLKLYDSGGTGLFVDNSRVGHGTTTPTMTMEVVTVSSGTYNGVSSGVNYSDDNWLYLFAGWTEPSLIWDDGNTLRFGVETTIGSGYDQVAEIDDDGNMILDGDFDCAASSIDSNEVNDTEMVPYIKDHDSKSYIWMIDWDGGDGSTYFSIQVFERTSAVSSTTLVNTGLDEAGKGERDATNGVGYDSVYGDIMLFPPLVTNPESAIATIYGNTLMDTNAQPDTFRVHTFLHGDTVHIGLSTIWSGPSQAWRTDFDLDAGEECMIQILINEE